MRKLITITLTGEQRRELEHFVHSGKLLARTVTRARIILLLDRSQDRRYTDRDISDALGCHTNMIVKTRKRFLSEGVSGILVEKPMGPATPVKITGDFEAKLILLACSTPPDRFANWSLRLLAEKSIELNYIESISHTAVAKVLKKTNENLVTYDSLIFARYLRILYRTSEYEKSSVYINNTCGRCSPTRPPLPKSGVACCPESTFYSTWQPERSVLGMDRNHLACSHPHKRRPSKAYSESMDRQLSRHSLENGRV